MYQGTTPSIIYNVKNYDLTGAKLYISFKKGNSDILTKSSGYTIAYDDETKISTVICSLTQEETLAFKSGAITTQIRFIFSDGQAYATNKADIEVKDIIYREVITFS